jgi:VWFA-related protein
MRIAILSLLLFPISLTAQQQPVPLVETIEVRVMNVEAIVTDRKGNPVRGLTADDFEIREAGSPQPITNFHEHDAAAPEEVASEAAATTPDPRRTRKFIFFIDDVSLTHARRKGVLAEMRRFLPTAMRPGDEVMIVRWRDGLVTELLPTSDVAAALKTLERIESNVTFGGERERSRTRVQERFLHMIRDAEIVAQATGEPILPSYDSAASEARLHADLVTRQVTGVLGAMNAVILSVSRLEGRKVLIYAGESLPARPGAEIFEFLDGIKQYFQGGQGRQPRTEALAFTLDSEIRKIADAANTAGVTLYPIDAGGLRPTSAAADVHISADINLHTSYAAAAQVDQINNVETFTLLADHTGGFALTGSNNLRLAFDTIRDDVSHFYSLGYRATGDSLDRLRALEVRVKNREYRVRARRSILERSAQAEIEELVQIYLVYEPPLGEIPVQLKVGEREGGDARNVTAPLEIVLPISSLTFISDGDDLVAQLSMYFAFVKQGGSVSKVTKQSQQIRFPASTLSRRKEVRLLTPLTAERTTEKVSVGVIDEISKSKSFAVTAF